MLKVRKAYIEDIDKIFCIKEQVYIDNIENLDSGFLTIDATKDNYKQYLELTSDFYVLTSCSKVIGFLIGGNDKSSNNIVDSKEIINDNNYFYIKQVAIDLNSNINGLGSFIYNYIFENIKYKKIYLSINEKPINKASVQFHKAMGFKKIKQAYYKEYPISIWKKNLI